MEVSLVLDVVTFILIGRGVRNYEIGEEKEGLDSWGRTPLGYGDKQLQADWSLQETHWNGFHRDKVSKSVLENRQS